MFEVLILAVALSMDAFAVSIGLGIKEKTNIKIVALKAGLLFGLFQALMPLIGYLGGRSIEELISGYDSVIAFVLLSLIGAKMIYESYQEKTEEEIRCVSNRIILTLAIATSIDAMAAGFTLHLFDLNPYVSVVIIGCTTFVFSYLGVYIGKTTGAKYEQNAEKFGGIVLILIGLKILIV